MTPLHPVMHLCDIYIYSNIFHACFRRLVLFFTPFDSIHPLFALFGPLFGPYIVLPYLTKFRRTKFSADKIFRRSSFACWKEFYWFLLCILPDKIFGKPDFRHFCPLKFCPIRYLYLHTMGFKKEMKVYFHSEILYFVSLWYKTICL